MDHFFFSYVDPTRMASYQTRTDLKSLISKSGLNKLGQYDTGAGAPNDAMFVKFAEHFIHKGLLKEALIYSQLANELNPESMVRVTNELKYTIVQAFLCTFTAHAGSGIRI